MAQDKFGDKRLSSKSGSAEDPRIARDSADMDRAEDGTALSASQRKQMLRQDWVQNILPQIPEIPGYHTCWLSTTNSVDPIHQRIRIGYTPVKASEVPGLLQFTVPDGQEYEGCIACREMLLFKIPLATYQDIMEIFHHDMPLEQETAIRDKVMGQQDSDSSGRDLSIVEGEFHNLGRNGTVRRPKFA